ncbi:glycosyltransferase family 2 protein [Jannaschia sp. S6380]|uniref:glycosyltransferase n=1 Tax=Jannaschia sp. S6380 TaxID=2926408 RepID=UPI001FF4C9DE|nr:glycosyltransferase [Jannaschia sp. S6380]MCK0168410.1 glycosyltransferase family 2 protein [Jannaschia sp. S6380]
MDSNLDTLAIYTMFAGHPAQIVRWCNYHLSHGAARLYVLLDRPDTSLTDALPEDPRIRWLPVGQEDWVGGYGQRNLNVERKQTDGFRWAARLARADGFDHLAFVDADELIQLAAPWSEIAEAVGEQTPAVTLPVREMWRDGTESLDDPFGARLALRPTEDEEKIAWPKLMGWRSQLLRRGLLGHRTGKAIYALPLRAGEMTVHGPKSGNLLDGAMALDDQDGRILHYDHGSFSTWQAKWAHRADGRALARGLLAKRRLQLHLFIAEMSKPEAEQRAFFAEFFSLPEPTIAKLTEAGLLEEVDLGGATEGPLALPAAADTLAPVAPTDPRDRVDFQFAFVTDENFASATFATQLSVLSKIGHLGRTRMVVLGDGLTETSVAKFKTLELAQVDVEVICQDITEDLDRDIGRGDPKRATFGRIYLIDYLPRQRTIYLDGDILATRDFSELFTMDLQGACLAGVPDSAALRAIHDPDTVPPEQSTRLQGITHGSGGLEQYINGGVLIMDLDNPDYHRMALEARSMVMNFASALKQRDQDAMNIAFAGRKMLLSSKYNYMTQYYLSDRCIADPLRVRKYAEVDASLIHYSGKRKPWVEAEPEFYNGLYRKMVIEAERQMGLSCDFYFSARPEFRAGSVGRRRMAKLLRAGSQSGPGRRADTALEILDLAGDGFYLHVPEPLLPRADGPRRWLVARSGGRVLFQVDLAGIRHPFVPLLVPTQRAVYFLPFDLNEVLDDEGGRVRDVEITLEPEGANEGGESFVRHVSSHVMIASDEDQEVALARSQFDGVIDGLSDGHLSGWARSGDHRDVPLSLHVAGKFAGRFLPCHPRPDLPENGPGFRVPVGPLLDFASAPSPVDLAVKIAGTNLSLRRGPLRVTWAGRYGWDADREVWIGRR